MLLFQPPCSEAYYSRLSFRSKSKEQLNERRAGLSRVSSQEEGVSSQEEEDESLAEQPEEMDWDLDI